MFKAHLSAEALISALKAIARELVELGKQAVAAAADVAASNAQFEQAFSGVDKEARKSLNSISKETGITATRMQGSFDAPEGAQEKMIAESTGGNAFSSDALIASGGKSEAYATLEPGLWRLDGTRKLLPDDPHPGWWSVARSDENGLFIPATWTPTALYGMLAQRLHTRKRRPEV